MTESMIPTTKTIPTEATMKAMKNATWMTLLATTLLASGCERGVRLETRTYRVDHLGETEVFSLIDPYVYGHREGDPGAISASPGAITVRETPDNLDRIEQVLAEFDRPRPDARLVFQLIEADGFTARDPRIAAVEDELRRIFRFEGYRLAGEATVTAADGAGFVQMLSGSDDPFEISGQLYRAGADGFRLQEVSLYSPAGYGTIETSVNVRSGQTVVLGSQPERGSTATLFLTVRVVVDEPAG